MVPIKTNAGAWHEEQIDELFSSLMGKGFESPQMPSENAAPQDFVGATVATDAPSLQGLRVF